MCGARKNFFLTFNYFVALIFSIFTAFHWEPKKRRGDRTRARQRKRMRKRRGEGSHVLSRCGLHSVSVRSFRSSFVVCGSAVPGRGWLRTMKNRITQPCLVQLIICLFGEINSLYLCIPCHRFGRLHPFWWLGSLQSNSGVFWKANWTPTLTPHQLQHALIRRDCSTSN